MSKIDKAVEWALAIANDATHGYDQASRWGPNYDCSSFLISAWEAAGVPVKTNCATYTGNMKSVFLKCGFADAATLNVVEFNMGAGLKKGDILLHEQKHTAMYLGDGRIVQASINELGTIKGGQSGDQSGGEIHIRNYYNFPWQVVLRYVGEEGESKSESTQSSNTVSALLPVIRKGNKGPAVAMLQAALKYHGYDPTWIDGDFGTRTHNMLTAFQKKRGLAVDGICGPMTWAELHKG